MSSYTVRDWVTIGLFGALWGALELTLGSALHVIFPSQANTFFTGLIMGGIGVTIALTGRRFVPRRGSVMLIAVVTALVKLLSPGGRKIGAFVAILIQGLLMETVLWLTARPRRWTFLLGGALAVAWNLPHKFVMMRLVYGRSAAQVYQKLVGEGSQMLGLDPSLALLILGILLAVRLAVGAVGGGVGWWLGDAVTQRLGERASSAGEASH